MRGTILSELREQQAQLQRQLLHHREMIDMLERDADGGKKDQQGKL